MKKAVIIFSIICFLSVTAFAGTASYKQAINVDDKLGDADNVYSKEINFKDVSAVDLYWNVTSDAGNVKFNVGLYRSIGALDSVFAVNDSLVEVTAAGDGHFTLTTASIDTTIGGKLGIDFTGASTDTFDIDLWYQWK